MKHLLVFLLGCSINAYAQTVDVNDVSADEEGSTTIEITKGKKEVKSNSKREIVEGSAPIESDPAATESDARKAFKTACATWQKELRAENQANGNIVLVANCGKADCSGSAGKKICSSSATYKISTKIE